jgi:hypothetical protein
LDRQIRRTWDAGVGYRRGVSIDDTFQQPVLSDSISASLGGLLSTRLNFHSAIGTSRGSIGANLSGNRFNAYYGTMGLTVGLMRQMGLGVNYMYAHHRLGNSVQAPTGLVRTLDRQVVVVQLSLMLPLWRSRSADASR